MIIRRNGAEIDGLKLQIYLRKAVSVVGSKGTASHDLPAISDS